MLFEDRADLRGCREIRFSRGVATLAAHVDEIGKRLSAGSALMEIGPFAAECIRRNHTLGLELVVTHGTTKLYLTQRCHGLLLPIGARTLGNR
jgi:hypothetical protein